MQIGEARVTRVARPGNALSIEISAFIFSAGALFSSADAMPVSDDLASAVWVFT